MRYASIRLLGVLGGLAGILIGAGEFTIWVFSSGQLPSSWIGSGLISPEVGALLFILLGVAGMISSLLYSESRRAMAKATLASGLLGFLVGLVSGSYLVGNLIYWIIPGAILTAVGYIAMATLGRLLHRFPWLRVINERLSSWATLFTAAFSS